MNFIGCCSFVPDMNDDENTIRCGKPAVTFYCRNARGARRAPAVAKYYARCADHPWCVIGDFKSRNFEEISEEMYILAGIIES